MTSAEKLTEAGGGVLFGQMAELPELLR